MQKIYNLSRKRKTNISKINWSNYNVNGGQSCPDWCEEDVTHVSRVSESFPCYCKDSLVQTVLWYIFETVAHGKRAKSIRSDSLAATRVSGGPYKSLSGGACTLVIRSTFGGFMVVRGFVGGVGQLLAPAPEHTTYTTTTNTYTSY